jgi:DNA-binding transcriptional regulator YbjK
MMGTASEQRRRRNPAERRRVIVEAAAELVVECGSAGLTHRMVAARAEVPLGSTTQYFATLDDLRAAALERLSEDLDGYLAEVRAALDDEAAAPAALASLLHEFLSDGYLVRANRAMAASAFVDPHVRSVLLRWFDQLVGVLSAHLDARWATAVAVFFDGAAAHAALHDEPLALSDVTAVLVGLFEQAGGRQ